MPPVDERHHVWRDFVAHMARRLGRPEITAHREDGQQVALGSVTNLGVATTERAEMPREMCPVFDIGQHVQQVAHRHALHQRFLQRDCAFRDDGGRGAAHHQLARFVDDHMLGLLGEPLIQLTSRVRKPLTQLGHEAGAAGGHAELLAVARQAVFALAPWQQVIAVVRKCVGAGHAQIAAAQFLGHIGQDAELEIATIGRGAQFDRTAHQLAPAFRGKAEVNVDGNPLPVQRLVLEHSFPTPSARSAIAWSIPMPGRAPGAAGRPGAP